MSMDLRRRDNHNADVFVRLKTRAPQPLPQQDVVGRKMMNHTERQRFLGTARMRGKRCGILNALSTEMHRQCNAVSV
jgi:hypothetical protein